MLWFLLKSSPPRHQLPVSAPITFRRFISIVRAHAIKNPLHLSSSAPKKSSEREKYQKDCLVMPGLIEARCFKAETAVFQLFYSSVSKSLSLAPSKLYFGLFINIHVRSFFGACFSRTEFFRVRRSFHRKLAVQPTSAWDTFLFSFSLHSLARGQRWRSRVLNKCFFRIFFRLLACVSLSSCTDVIINSFYWKAYSAKVLGRNRFTKCRRENSSNLDGIFLL